MWPNRHRLNSNTRRILSGGLIFNTSFTIWFHLLPHSMASDEPDMRLPSTWFEKSLVMRRINHLNLPKFDRDPPSCKGKKRAYTEIQQLNPNINISPKFYNHESERDRHAYRRIRRKVRSNWRANRDERRCGRHSCRHEMPPSAAAEPAATQPFTDESLFRLGIRVFGHRTRAGARGDAIGERGCDGHLHGEGGRVELGVGGEDEGPGRRVEHPHRHAREGRIKISAKKPWSYCWSFAENALLSLSPIVMLTDLLWVFENLRDKYARVL